MKSFLSQVHWTNTIFLTLTPLLAVWTGFVYFSESTPTLALLAVSVCYWMMTSLSITGGYHRLISHRAYQSKPWVKFLYLVFGSACFEGSALKWCTDHRRHHAKTDTDEDPYSIKKGFWYAHVLWVLQKENPKYLNQFPHDLRTDPLVRWQDRWNVPLSLVMGFGVPTLIGYAMGDTLGGFFFMGILRVVGVHHSTFFVNSLCHIIGKQPYGTETSARDHFLLAYLTYGEGYHNFHHKFQKDYRNGLLWFQFDPTKWLIRFFEWIGAASDLHLTSPEEILRAKLETDQKRVAALGAAIPELDSFRERVLAAQARWHQAKASYRAYCKEQSDRSRENIRQLKLEARQARREFVQTWREWKRLARLQITAGATA
jgi:stearoyl-CoA desaturase (delta-9 desaturase)